MRLLADEKRLSLQVEAAEPVEAEGDQSRLQQVVVNLLDNAIKYTPEGGSVRVHRSYGVRQSCFDRKRYGNRASRTKANLISSERFYRTDKARSRQLGGTGLGLSIVKSIGAAHGGCVSGAERGKVAEAHSGLKFRDCQMKQREPNLPLARSPQQ